MIPLSLMAIIPAGIIAYLALSKKTSPLVKKVSTGALILIIITLVVCVILILMSGARAIIVIGVSEPPPDPIPAVEGKSDLSPIIALVAVLLFLTAVLVISFRDQKKQKGAALLTKEK
jgi:hypothetical protein